MVCDKHQACIIVAIPGSASPRSICPASSTGSTVSIPPAAGGPGETAWAYPSAAPSWMPIMEASKSTAGRKKELASPSRCQSP